MSRLLTTYANMLEASVRTPEWFPGRRPSPVELERRLRVVALLRSLTPDEAAALVRGQQSPVRLGALADEVGLSVEECGRELAAIVWKLTEGLRHSPTRTGKRPNQALHLTAAAGKLVPRSISHSPPRQVSYSLGPEGCGGWSGLNDLWRVMARWLQSRSL